MIRERLLIRYSHLTTERVEWLTIGLDQQARDAGVSTLAECGQQFDAQTTECIVLLPGAQAHCLPLAYEKQVSSKIRHVLPYALEESILTPIDETYYAILSESADTLHCCVLQHAIMQETLRTVQAAGLSVCAIYPEHVLLANQSLFVESECVHIKCTPAVSFTVTHERLPLFLAATLRTYAESWDIIYTDKAALAHVYQHLPEQKRRSVRCVAKPLGFFAECLPTHTLAVSLCQAQYAVRRQAGSTQRMWFASGMMLSLAMLVALMGGMLRYYQWRGRVAHVDAETLKLFQHVFPKAQTVNSPRVLLTRELSKVASERAGATFFKTLWQIGATLRATPSLQLDGLGFSNGVISVTLQAQNFASLEQFRQQLQMNRLQVKQDQALRRNSQGVQARFEIRGMP